MSRNPSAAMADQPPVEQPAPQGPPQDTPAPVAVQPESMPPAREAQRPEVPAGDGPPLAPTEKHPISRRDQEREAEESAYREHLRSIGAYPQEDRPAEPPATAPETPPAEPAAPAAGPEGQPDQPADTPTPWVPKYKSHEEAERAQVEAVRKMTQATEEAARARAETEQVRQTALQVVQQLMAQGAPAPGQPTQAPQPPQQPLTPEQWEAMLLDDPKKAFVALQAAIRGDVAPALQSLHQEVQQHRQFREQLLAQQQTQAFLTQIDQAFTQAYPDLAEPKVYKERVEPLLAEMLKTPADWQFMRQYPQHFIRALGLEARARNLAAPSAPAPVESQILAQTPATAPAVGPPPAPVMRPGSPAGSQPAQERKPKTQAQIMAEDERRTSRLFGR